jgi:hypothetical protein
MTQYRQGDVFIESATGIPKGARPVARVQGRIILAEGEVTGHTHAVLDREAELHSVSDQVDFWLRVGTGGAQVVHEEHGVITLPPGDYRVRRQREYAPGEIRRVAD